MTASWYLQFKFRIMGFLFNLIVFMPVTLSYTENPSSQKCQHKHSSIYSNKYSFIPTIHTKQSNNNKTNNANNNMITGYTQFTVFLQFFYLQGLSYLRCKVNRCVLKYLRIIPLYVVMPPTQAHLLHFSLEFQRILVSNLIVAYTSISSLY